MTILTDALGYATRLATTLWEKHYRADAPQWKPLPDLLGVLTQIDNMTSGLSRAIEAELSKQKPVARPRLPRIDHFAREAFEKFASGVECELTNYRWFEAGWDARGDTVAAAPLPSAPAQSITDYMMDLVDRLGHEAENVDPKAWQHLLVYAPKPSAPDTVQVPDPKPRWFDI